MLEKVEQEEISLRYENKGYTSTERQRGRGMKIKDRRAQLNKGKKGPPVLPAKEDWKSMLLLIPYSNHASFLLQLSA